MDRDDLDNKEVVEKFLSNESWIDECFKEFKLLLEEADDFGMEGLSVTE